MDKKTLKLPYLHVQPRANLALPKVASSAQREFKFVPARCVHPSTIIPPRMHAPELADSVTRVGIQQPIIVRPLAAKPGEYEIVDGAGRREVCKESDEILVDVRAVTDSETFKIADATSVRKERTAYETALFYARWLKALEQDEGASEGLQQKLAGITSLSESSVSQYLAINRLFEKLRDVAPNEPFDKLKAWSVNKLYKLSELTDDARLVTVATMFELKFETSPEEVDEAVNSFKGKVTESLEDASAAYGQEETQSSIEHQPTSHVSTTICLKSAKRVGALATETLGMLDTTVQELMQDADRLSSSEVLQVLSRVLYTLRKLKKTSSLLRDKMKLQSRQDDVQ